MKNEPLLLPQQQQQQDESKVRQVDLLRVTKSPLILTFLLSDHFLYFYFSLSFFHPRYCRLSSPTFLLPGDIILFHLVASPRWIENATDSSQLSSLI